MPQTSLLKSVLFVFLFSLSLCAQNLTETRQKIQPAVENRDYQTAVGELQNLEKSDKKIFTLNNYDYLLARMAEKRGDFALAATEYQAVASRNSVLSEYALRHLSQIARDAGNLLLERIYLQKISILAPDSLLTNVVKARMPRSYFESKNFDTAIELLNNQQSITGTQNQTKDEAKSRETQTLLGEAYLQNNQIPQARQIFTQLINNLPNPAQPDDFALDAAKNLDLLDGGAENFGKTAPQLIETEHYRRALIYQFNRNFPLARLHFQAIVQRFPASNYVSAALYQIGRGYAQEGNFAAAIDWFERVQAEFPTDDVARDALSQTASAYSRVNKTKEAIARYQKFIQTYPNADNLERAYLNIADILRDKGEDSEALKWAAKTQTDFNGKLPATLALFVRARIHISQNDWTNALADLNNLLMANDLGGTRVPGGTNKPEVTFLKGLALENLKRFDEAIETYLLIADGRGEYYGWRATERLKLLANNETAKPFVAKNISELTTNLEVRNAEAQRRAAQAVLRLTDAAAMREKMLAIVRRSYQQLPDYQKVPNGKLLEFGRREIVKENREISKENRHKILADELLFLGLYDEGTPELNLYFQQTQTKITDDINFTLATFYERGDLANRAVAYIEPLWKNMPADYQLELIPRGQIELLYPTPYSDSLLQFAPAKQVDPRFILAIMRQESRFRADVKSYAAARGLMQFISTTANQIAQELNRENFRQDELYNPPTAILFGSQYLSNLFHQFPDQPAAVAASYNGGEDNVTRWLTRAESADPDRYMPEIVYSQSKDYVYKVMANYRVYQMFYDEKLKATTLR